MLRDDQTEALDHQFAKSYARSYGLPGLPASIVTDRDGRLRLARICRDHIVEIVL